MLTHVGVFSVDFSRIDTGKTVCFLVSGGLRRPVLRGSCSAPTKRRIPTPVCGLARNDRERDVGNAVPYSAKRCHCEPVTVSLVWQSVIPHLPLRGRCQREAVTEGETAHIPRRDTWVPPYRVRRVCWRDAAPYEMTGGRVHITPGGDDLRFLVVFPAGLCYNIPSNHGGTGAFFPVRLKARERL